MLLPWLWAGALLAAACFTDAGSSLRVAVEALQRRQRGHSRAPVVPFQDYDALYEFIPPGYPEPDYPVDIEDIEGEHSPKYIVKLLDENDRPPENYEYKIIKKKNFHSDSNSARKESAFRERIQHSDNDRLKDLFGDRRDPENKNDKLQEEAENDAEYALLLGQLWSKYKNQNVENSDSGPVGIVKLHKEKRVKKRYSDNWGPIAFKRKRSSDFLADIDRSIQADNAAEKKPIMTDHNYNTYDINDNDDKDEWRDEYAIAFQPLNEMPISELGEEDQYNIANEDKRFPVTKRSSGTYDINKHKKRFILGKNKRDGPKAFRSYAGTDPRIIKDLSKIFGDVDITKNPVKRNADREESSHEVKPPQMTLQYHNGTHDRNITNHDDNSHEHHGHNLHHPGMNSQELDNVHDHIHEQSHHDDKPLTIKKKSIDWSDYFGIDKRAKKFVNSPTQDLDLLRKQYFDTFNREVVNPLNSFQKHSYSKRNYMPPKPIEESELQSANTHPLSIRDKKRNNADDANSKLDTIDKKLKNMEGIMVDEALHYSEMGEELDSKEEQEMKEKLLSRLAAAYSLEKMRKALKEFKQSLQTQRTESTLQPTPFPTDESKTKRVAIKKELLNNEIPSSNEHDKSDDFEDEQGAGHYVNGKIDQPLSEGYMGGSGRHRIPAVSPASAPGACPILSKIAQRCRGVDMLAGDRGQLFLPLCSLHQICYLCGEAPPTTCDLVFLSEADTTCEGDVNCQRAARSALMALRELHDILADEMDGECEASPCLPATLKLNMGWQRTIQR